MTSEEEIKLSPYSKPWFRLNTSEKRDNTKRKPLNTSDSDVMLRSCKGTMQIYNLIPILLIFSTLAVLSNGQAFDVLQQDAEYSPQKSRTKRWTTEVEVTQSYLKQQSSSIPAANPNFEAAFQGECGKNNNSNPCEHICLDLHDGTYECSCFYGFALAVDGYSCASLDKSPLSTTSSPTFSPPSTPLASLLPTNNNKNKFVQGNLKGEPIFNQNKVANLPEVNSRIEDMAQRRGLDFSDQFEIDSNNKNVEANRNTSDGSNSGSSSNGFAEIDQTNSGQELLKFRATEYGRVSDSRKLAGKLAKGTNLKHNEITSLVNGVELRKFEADYLEKKGKNKVGGVSSDVSAAQRRRQRRLPNTAAAWIQMKVAEESEINNQNSDSNYNNNISSNDDGNYHYNDSGPPYEESYFVHAQQQQQQQNTSYQLSSEQPVKSKVAEQANIIVEKSIRQEELKPTTRARITEASGNRAVILEAAARYSNSNNNNKGHSMNYHWPKYDVGQTEQKSNKGQFIKFQAAQNERQQNNNNKDDVLVDPDIESIMISNDKLLRQLEDLVSVASQSNENDDSQDDVDDKEANERDSDKTIERISQQKEDRGMKLEAVKVEFGTEKAGQEHGYHDRQEGNYERGTDGKDLDYDLDLLEDLVRKTFEDSTREQKQELGQKQRRKEPYQEEGKSKQGKKQGYLIIDRDVPIELNRSSLVGDENGSRTRRSSRHGGGSPKSTKGEFADTSQQTLANFYNNNNRIRKEQDPREGFLYEEEEPPLSEDRIFSDYSGSNMERGVFGRGVDIQNSVNDRLCVGEKDNENNRDYRDCWDLPECESGGKCIAETKWFYNHSNPNLVLQTYPRCQCPIGRGGFSCQKPIQRKIPKFSGKSYLALPMIKDSSLSNLHFLFRPFGSNLEQEQTSLLLYSEKFLLLLDDLSRVELRYITQDSGSKITRVIGSRDAEVNKWNELLITDDASSDESSQIMSNLISPKIPMNRIVLVLPDKIQLQDHSQATDRSSMELFVAGVPDAFRSKGAIRRQHSPLTMDKENLGGFNGCIRELSLNRRAYNFRSDLNGDTLDGFDIGECCVEN